MKIALYARVSTEDQELQHRSRPASASVNTKVMKLPKYSRKRYLEPRRNGLSIWNW